MRAEESLWIKSAISGVVTPDSLCINLGSSDEVFYQEVQPHIFENIVGYVRHELGAVLLNCDSKSSEGVDMVGDFTSPQFLDEVLLKRPSLILINNLFEHMMPDALSHFVTYLDQASESGTKILITVPFSYPIHFDPIDTYFRPSPDELADLFPGWRVLKQDVICSQNYAEEFRQLSWRQVFYLMARLGLPFIKPKGWIARLHRFFWWNRRFKISGVLLEKP